MAIVTELQLVLLLATVWVTERLCKRINVSPIIGQILAGLIVGPALIDVIPHVQAFRLLGKVGVMVLVVESGLIVDLDDVRRYGWRASLAAATGVILPTILSFVLFSGIIGTNWKTSLAVGAAISPTSLGFSAQMLGEVGELTSPCGQLICTAAVIDDVLSLLLLAEVQVLGEEDPKWYAYVLPVIASIGSVLVGGVAAVLISSRTTQLSAWLSKLNHRPDGDIQRHAMEPSAEDSPGFNTIPRTDDTLPSLGGGNNFESSPFGDDQGRDGTQVQTAIDIQPREFRSGDMVLLAMVLALALLFAYLSASVGSSDLLGCFLGGLAFSRVPGVQQVWARQMKRYTQWGARLFFSCTVAFSVPAILGSDGLFSIKPFWKGLALTFAAVVGKLAVGVFAGPPLTFLGFSKLGWAMNGRGEFSFFIAQEASEEGILTAEDYSAVVWALLLSSIAAPIAFRKVLEAGRQMIPESNVESAANAHRSRPSCGETEMGSLAGRQ